MSNCYDCGAHLGAYGPATYVPRDGFLSVPVCADCYMPDLDRWRDLPNPDPFDILWQARPWADERSAL